MKYFVAALAGLLLLSMHGDYLSRLFAILLGAVAMWCLYRAITSYQEWQMPEEKWLAKIEADELKKENEAEMKRHAAEETHDEAKEKATDAPKGVGHRAVPRRSRTKRTKADGFAVTMFVLMALILGGLSYQALNYRDDGGSSSSMPAANFTASSTTMQGADVSGRKSSSPVLYLAAGLGFIFLGAASGIASVVARKRCPQYVKPITGAAAAFMLLGGGCLALNMFGTGSNNTAGSGSSSAVSAVGQATASGEEGNSAVVDDSSRADEENKNEKDKNDALQTDMTTVVDRAMAVQDKAAVKKYIERENPFAKLTAAKKQAGINSSFENADAKILERYLFAVGKLSEGALDPQRIVKDAEETAKIYEEFYGNEFLLVTEWYNAKKKHKQPDEKTVAEFAAKRDVAEEKIRRLANWCEAKL